MREYQEYHLLKPNFKRLKPKYLGIDKDHFKYLQETLISNNYEYRGNITFYKHVEPKIIEILQRSEYSLAEHKDDILYMCFFLIEIIWGTTSIKEDYESINRAKELANLLLKFANSNSNDKPSEIKFNAINTEASISIKDQHLIEWIGQLILKATQRVEFPVLKFGEAMCSIYGLLPNRITINEEKLQEIASTPIDTVTKEHRKNTIDFCLYLYNYIHNETHLKSERKGVYTNTQLKLIFNIISAFGLINEDTISSPPKDYMRKMLKSSRQTS